MKDQKVMMFQIGVLSAVFLINFVVRMFEVDHLLAEKTSPPVSAGTTKIRAFESSLNVMEGISENLPQISHLSSSQTEMTALMLSDRSTENRVT